jgi:hypothetical protein
MRHRRPALAGLLLLLVAALWALWPEDRAPIAAAPPAEVVAEVAPERAHAEPAAEPPVEPEAEAPADPDDPDEDDPHRAIVATCRVDPPLEAAAGFLTLGDAATLPYQGQPVEIVDGVLRMPPSRRLGAGVLTVEGYAPVRVLWSGSEQGCAPDPIRLVPGDAWITGRVHNAEGEPEGRVYVEGCGARALPDSDGAYAMTVLPGRCTLDAYRRDGGLLVSAGPAEVDAAAGEERVVDFTLPDAPQGGLGMMIRGSDAGVHIIDVVPGSAAAELGLARGDLVVEVDGTVTAGMDLRSFVDLAIGPAGTEVDLVVERDGALERLTLDRRLLQ